MVPLIFERELPILFILLPPGLADFLPRRSFEWSDVWLRSRSSDLMGPTRPGLCSCWDGAADIFDGGGVDGESKFLYYLLLEDLLGLFSSCWREMVVFLVFGVLAACLLLFFGR
jgi:hypothetical protein